MKVALITGSGRKRIGNVVAWDLARAGYAIALHYHRSRQDAKETVQGMADEGLTAASFAADVADEQDVDRMTDDVLERFGRIDALITTASIWDTKPLDQVTADDMRRNFDVNTLGTFLCARRAGLAMVDQPEGGSIVTFGDWAISRPYVDHIAYFAAKGAIPTLTRALAVELAARNPRVRVNCIHPGPVMFPPGMTEDEQQSLVEATLVKRADDPASVSQAVRFFIENPMVTGVCLPVDGGRTIYAPE
ncbi:MAG: SDR family oxidoreductase [Planctomycetales bacterium]|nr:SDR family oxidoreductase [Planctomycetales bacterium]